MHGYDTSPQRDYSHVTVLNEVVDEIVDTHRRLQLLGKSFKAWERSLSKHQVVYPITKSSLVDACCRWMRLSFSEYESSSGHLFPFYAVVENHYDKAAFFVSRLRPYMVDRLEVPVQSLPLLIHSVAVLDALQMRRCFDAWRQYSVLQRELDRYADARLRRRCLRTWRRVAERRVFTRYRAQAIRRKSGRALTLRVMRLWMDLYRVSSFLRRVGSQRLSLSLLTLRRFANTAVFQRLSHRNAVRFFIHKRLLNAYRRWISRLIHKSPSLASSLLQIQLQPLDDYKDSLPQQTVRSLVLRNWLESMALRRMIVASYGHRSLWFRGHRLVHRLADPLPDAPTTTPTTTTITTTTTSGSFDSVALLIALQSLRSNPSSRFTQALLVETACRFHRYRRLLYGLKTWCYRVPQIRLDSNDYCSLFPTEASKQRSRRSRGRNADTITLDISSYAPMHDGYQEGEKSYYYNYYFTHKVLSRSLRHLAAMTRRRIFHRIQGLQVRRSSTALLQTRAFGAWLITAARYQQLRRRANRLLCNRLNLMLWQAWFGWRHQYERAVLIKSNNHMMLKLRNIEIQELGRRNQLKRTQQVKYSALKDWSLTVKDRQRGRVLIRVWNSTAGMRKLFFAWSRWRVLLSLDVIATCLKKLWRGFKARKIDHAHAYYYLKRFRVNAPKYLSFRKRSCQRKIFAILKRFHLQIRSICLQRMTHFAYRSTLKVLRLFQSKSRRYRRTLQIGRIHIEMFGMRCVFRRMRWRRKKLQLMKRLLKYSIIVTYRRTLQSMARLKQRRLTLKKSSAWYVARTTRTHFAFLLRQLRMGQLVRIGRWKMRQYLLRKHFTMMKQVFQTIFIVKNYRTIRVKLLAARFLRRWVRRLRREAHRRALSQRHHERGKLRKFFRWLMGQQSRRQHSERLTGSNGGRRVGSSSSSSSSSSRGGVVTDKKKRGGRKECKLVRGVVSIIVRRAFRVFCTYTGRHRQSRSQLSVIGGKVDRSVLRKAFSQLLGHRTVKKSRQHGKRWLGWKTGNTEGRGRNGYDKQQQQHQVIIEGKGRNRYDKQQQQQQQQQRGITQKQPLDRMSTMRHTHIGRDIPLSRDQMLQRMQNNLKFDDAATSLLVKGLLNWLSFHRYNAKHYRVLSRLSKAHNQKMMKLVVHKLILRLSAKRKFRNKVQRTWIIQRADKMRSVIALLDRKWRRLRRYREAVSRHRQSKRKQCILQSFHVLRHRSHFAYLNRKLTCVRRLKLLARLLLQQMRARVWRQLQLFDTKAAAVYHASTKKRRVVLRRLRWYRLHHRYRSEISSVALKHRILTAALRYFRYWRRCVKMSSKLRRIRRRIALRPSLAAWHKQSGQCIRYRHIIEIIRARVYSRIKASVLHQWKEMSAGQSQLRLRASRVVFRVALLRKHSVLYRWLRVMDGKILFEKFQRAVEVRCRYTIRRFLFHWHKQTLISELHTLRSASVAVRNLLAMASSVKRRRQLFSRAAAFYDAYLAQTFLYLWYKRTARDRRLLRRTRGALRAAALQKYQMYFRLWKRRMFMLYKCSGLYLAQPLRNRYDITKQRSINKWRRVMHKRVNSRRLKALKALFAALRDYSYKQRYGRMAFSNRLAFFYHKSLLLRIWSVLVSNADQLKAKRTLSTYTDMLAKSKVWHFWRRLYVQRWKERKTLQCLPHALYALAARWMFYTWKVRTSISYSLAKAASQSRAWHCWRLLLSARIQFRLTVQQKVFGAWKAYIISVDDRKRLGVWRRRRLMKIAVREMHREELKVFVAFHRWKSRDESVLLCHYHRYQDLWTRCNSHSHRRRGTHPIGAPLSKTNLGPLLQRWPRVADRVSSPHSQPPQRLDAIRSQLEKRWLLGGGVTDDDGGGGGGKRASRGGSPSSRGSSVQHGAILSTAPGGQSYRKAGPYAWGSHSHRYRSTTYSDRASESHAESKSDNFTPMRMMTQGSRRRPVDTNQLLSRDTPIMSARDLSLLKSKGKNLNIDELM